MKVLPSGTLGILLLAAGAFAVLTIIIVVYSVRQFSSPPPEGAAPPQEEEPANRLAPSASSPSLYCEFYDFMHERVIVGFGFAVALPKDAPPRFDEWFEGTRDGTQIFDVDQRKTWSYARDEDGTQMITSPDGATRIMLYGLKLDTGGLLADEAGLRSNDYRNLDGLCRQNNLGVAR